MAACDQPAELHEIETHIEPISKEEWFESLKATVDRKHGGKDVQNKTILPRKPKIQRVARILRKNESNKDCFEPLAVSIGPYHRNNKDLKPMEKLKASMAGQYLKGQMEQLYGEVVKVAAEARECYAEDATKGMSDQEFTRMMFLDGCFFLQFIIGDIQMKKHDEAFVSRDLFLLENQIPFIVLKALSGSSDPVEKMMDFISRTWPYPLLIEGQSNAEAPEGPVKKIVDFIRRTSCCYPQLKKEQSNAWAEKEQSKAEGEPTIHLLQLLRKSLLNPEDLEGKEKGGRGGGGGGGASGGGGGNVHQLLRKSLLNPEDLEGGGVCGGREDCVGGGGEWHTYRSTNVLKNVGIHFRKSRSHRFTDVGFNPNLGLLGIQSELRLPPMYVDDFTQSRLLNLVAYEMCADVPEEAADVTSYICFLDELIDSAEDVMELRSHGILLNHLGSDKQVANLFNNITDNLVPNPMVYARVNEQIEKHYKNRVKIWILERLSTNFKVLEIS